MTAETVTREPVTMSTVRGGRFEVTPGVVDGNARHVFRNGQCHALAVAISEATGWDIYGITGWNVYSHFVVVTPDGKVIDIDGIRDEEDFMNDWHVSIEEMEPVTIDEIDYMVDCGDYLEMAWEVAQVFARTILDSESATS